MVIFWLRPKQRFNNVSVVMKALCKTSCNNEYQSSGTDHVRCYAFRCDRLKVEIGGPQWKITGELLNSW